jgi:hypothetical protein
MPGKQHGGTQLLQILPGLGGTSHIRMGDYLQQGYTGAIESTREKAVLGNAALMHQLACILFQVSAHDTDALALAVSIYVQIPVKAQMGRSYCEI